MKYNILDPYGLPITDNEIEKCGGIDHMNTIIDKCIAHFDDGEWPYNDEYTSDSKLGSAYGLYVGKYDMNEFKCVSFILSGYLESKTIVRVTISVAMPSSPYSFDCVSSTGGEIYKVLK